MLAEGIHQDHSFFRRLLSHPSLGREGHAFWETVSAQADCEALAAPDRRETGM